MQREPFLSERYRAQSREMKRNESNLAAEKYKRNSGVAVSPSKGLKTGYRFKLHCRGPESW